MYIFVWCRTAAAAAAAACPCRAGVAPSGENELLMGDGSPWSNARPRRGHGVINGRGDSGEAGAAAAARTGGA